MKDPLIKTESYETFQRVATLLHGLPINKIIDLAVNLQVNALRQTYADRSEALLRLDELHAKAREALAAQYSASGKRLQGVYPFSQTIHMPLVEDDANYADSVRR